jgi:hypothetical protein
MSTCVRKGFTYKRHVYRNTPRFQGEPQRCVKCDHERPIKAKDAQEPTKSFVAVGGQQ